MKIGELKRLIADAPDDFDLEILYGHSTLGVVATTRANFGKAVTITVEEDRDDSDPAKHEDA